MSYLSTQAFYFFFFFLNDPAPTEISSLPLHAALPISGARPEIEEDDRRHRGRDLLRQIVAGRKRRDRPRAVVGAKALEQATTVGGVDAGDRDRAARDPRSCPHAHTTLVRATKVPYREQREKPRILGSWRRVPESFEHQRHPAPGRRSSNRWRLLMSPRP